MKIALAQINPRIGDFTYNGAKILRRVEEAKAKGCDLIIFPELALSGYPPQDLLERDAYLADHKIAFVKLVNGITGIGVLCGMITRNETNRGKPLHNSAILFEDGEIICSVNKKLLPAYDVFDETRYFEPGRRSATVSYKGLRLGVTICEDIWNEAEVFPSPLYQADPVSELVSAVVAEGGRIDLLINISASPFHIGKSSIRHKILAGICKKFDLPLVYVNQVGGQDSLLFDGNSLAMNSAGRVVVRAAGFKEDMVLFAAETLKENHVVPIVPPTRVVPERDETAAVFEALVMGVRDYVAKCGFSRVVLGLSGGIDSALTAAIACEALEAENVLGVVMPSPFTSKESIEDAHGLAVSLGCGYESLPITGIFKAYGETLSPLFSGERSPGVTEQNIQARIRGNLLMAISNKFGHMVLSTGNKSEMAVGYCTLYGDMSGGLAVVADVPKQLIYKLASHVNRDGEIIPARILSKAPSAELAPHQFDQDDLPPYDVLDPILAAYLEENRSINQIVRMGFDQGLVEDIVRRINRNEYKRQQAPPCLKVTTKAFGYGRRYPIVQHYQEGAY